MERVHILSPEHMSRGFVPAQYLPQGIDEHHYRNLQADEPEGGWRQLHEHEVELLVKNNNTAGNWQDVLVSDPFDASLIKNSRFFGLVRIGCLRRMVLQHHDMRLLAGITNSTIIDCDLGHDVAIHDVHYLAHYIIGERNMLFNIDEMHTTSHAKFGNGVVKDGEPESVRIWLDLMNEAGVRRVMPFNGMTSADAYLWARYVDDAALQQQLAHFTQNHVDHRRGYYGTTGEHCVIKNSRILKDVAIGSHCYIKGANKLKNLTINSSGRESTQIGEGVELVNGIVGYGCRIFYGCKAVRFVLGNNSHLKYGARLIHSFLGDNSTISCCEVLNNLIFPSHEQHHNNSFLVASLVMGQSNMAAGATIGSNHNSRANDNEIHAGRGFWPGLCTSLKHPSRFASFVLIAKADYPAELNIPLPFALVSNNVAADRLEVMPAYWWLYNMYALKRNAWKYRQRDTRITRTQHIEYDTLAPDTIEECITARQLLAERVGVAYLAQQTHRVPEIDAGLNHEALGTKLLEHHPELVDLLHVTGVGMENTRRETVILKAAKAWKAYGDMMLYYAVTNLIDFHTARPSLPLAEWPGVLGGERVRRWVNMGGQLMRETDVDALRADIGNPQPTTLNSWEEIHARYDALWEQYPLHKQQHAWAVWCLLSDTEHPTIPQWREAVKEAKRIQQYICDQVVASRKKDYDNPFRKALYRNEAECQAIDGDIDDNPFITEVKVQTERFAKKAAALRVR